MRAAITFLAAIAQGARHHGAGLVDTLDPERCGDGMPVLTLAQKLARLPPKKC